MKVTILTARADVAIAIFIAALFSGFGCALPTAHRPVEAPAKGAVQVTIEIPGLGGAALSRGLGDDASVASVCVSAANRVTGFSVSSPLVKDGSGFKGSLTIPEAQGGTIHFMAYAMNSLGLPLYSGYVSLLVNSSSILSIPVHALALSKISAGRWFTVAIKASNGSVWAWGKNDYGQLGDGTYVSKRSPVQVLKSAGVPLLNATAVSAGEDHVLALLADGTVWAWGNDDSFSGRLGSMSCSPKYYATQVSTITNAVGVAAGHEHSLAVLQNGTVKAWGSNDSGQLGNNATSNFSTYTPATVNAIDGTTLKAVAVAAGDDHSLALLSDGRIMAWGDNSVGQLGNGTTTASLVPVFVSSISTALTISAGDWHSLAVLNDGSVRAWGRNSNGELGDGSTTNRSSPVQASGVYDAIAVSAGKGAVHTWGAWSSAMLADGGAYVWGNNYDGSFGTGSVYSSNSPVKMTALSSLAALAEGWNHGAALDTSAMVYAWGGNNYGQIGDGKTTVWTAPRQVAGLSGVTALSQQGGTGNHSFALGAGGTVSGWGKNDYDQVDVYTESFKSSPVALGSLSGVQAISAGDSFTVALLGDQTLLAWGQNFAGQLGTGDTWSTSSRVQVLRAAATALTGVTKISSGYTHSLAIDTNGAVWAWGSNGYGQLGDGTTTNRYYATAVSGLDGTLDAVEVAAGQNFSLALMADGTLRAWGVNDLGQLGNGTKTNSSAPVHVLASAGVDLARVRHISAGQYHGLALVGSSDTDLSDPALWTARSWGGNYSAQLGDYTTVEKTYPVQVKTGSSAYLTGIKKVAGGGGHTLFLLTDGTVWTAGRNWDGIRGTGGDPVFSDMAPGSYAVKASVIDGSSLAAADIAAGSSHSAALMSDGTVYAWGSNDYGQVGDGSTSMLLLPVARGAL